MNNEQFSFKLVDKDTPEIVVRRAIDQINEATRGHVTANIAEYDGPIQSYVRKTGLLSAFEAFQSTSDKIDIQQELGEQSDEHHRYEVYLSVSGLDHYKYRMLFMDYGAIAYPVTIVLNETLAIEYSGQNKDIFYVSTMQELEDMMNKIIESEIMIKLLQSLINESLRQKYRVENMTLVSKASDKD